jgi:hypothetical protein
LAESQDKLDHAKKLDERIKSLDREKDQLEILQLTIEHNKITEEALKLAKDGAERARKARYGK